MRRTVYWSFVASLSSIAVSIFALLGTAHPLAADEPNATVSRVDFNSQIRPILTKHCTSCHGGVKQAGGVSFVYGDLAMDTIEPGDPESSLLLERVLDEDDDYRMPPPEHGPALGKKETDLLTNWIQQGAVWGKHWAYENPTRHEVTDLKSPQWVKQPIDAFVLRQLEQREIKPAGDERPERWLRRVSLDLIGLPPTLQERQAFLKQIGQKNESAYEAVVDRLLASPRFGERWASPWFDQVRYADSRGQGEDSPRTIWKYRDWVIDALNQDMPYDQFTIKQIAGDLLPDRTIEDHIATAVHRLTHTNEEGGTDDEEFRTAAVLDRVSTTWQTWQGTTFGCVQCHHHPYDPFEHDEFYKFVAFFNNTTDCDLNDDWPNIKVPLDPKNYDQSSKLSRDIDKLKRAMWQKNWDAVSDESKWTALKIHSASTSCSTADVEIQQRDGHDEFAVDGTIASGTTVKANLSLAELDAPVTGLRITGLPFEPKTALADSEWGFVMSNITARLILEAVDEKTKKPKTRAIKIASVLCDEPFPYYDPNESLNTEKPGFAAYSRIHRARQAVLVFESPIDITENSKLAITIKHRVTELAAFPLVTRRAHFAISTEESFTKLLQREQHLEDQEKLTALSATLDEIESTEVPVLNEREENLSRPTHKFIGGSFQTKGKRVTSDVPKSLRPTGDPISNRLELARWMVGPDNPLTARVAVNRYWARMFGVGLVATEEDFGSTGEPPSHPELLDDLAVRFREDLGWSTKKLLKEIALSHTYRQSSKIRAELHELDAANRWLARGPRHSLPAETVRDQMLAISGLLSDKMFGEPVHPPLPRGVWKARRGTWKTPKVGEEDRYRRSVYTYVKRSVPFPISTTFDAPSRDFCTPKRLRSNTPLQPLMMMNDTGFVECAEALGKRMQTHSESLSEQIAYGLELATCREPKEDEVERLTKLYRAVEADSNAKVAMQSTASVMLNLDEIITK